MTERANIKRFINCIANENYKNAYTVLSRVITEKVKKDALMSMKK